MIDVTVTVTTTGSSETTASETEAISSTTGSACNMDGVCDANETPVLCPDECKCGNGMPDDGEECDDGNDDNTDACSNMCKNAFCGDGFVEIDSAEECDDGNIINTDSCINTCKKASCDDGYLQAGEECDDKGDAKDDTCNKCRRARRAFLTNNEYTGNQINGVAGADLQCTTIGNSVVGLAAEGNTWIAWLSQDGSSPSTRVAASNLGFEGWYLLPSGIRIAEGWSELTDGSIEHAINESQNGAIPAGNLLAWTNTATDGTTQSLQDDCDSWSSNDPRKLGIRGSAQALDGKWSNLGTLNCDQKSRLYCFEVSP